MHARIAAAAMIAAIAWASDASAGPFRNRQRTQSPVPSQSFRRCENGSCQAVAEAMASDGHLAHRGNPTGTWEGIGFSTTSPQDALDRCCYSQSGMTVVDSGVARGSRGYFAAKRYVPSR